MTPYYLLKKVCKLGKLIFKRCKNKKFIIGTRGGLVQASMLYAKANDHKVPGYDETKEKSWLIYQDCKYIFQIVFIF